MLWFRFTKMRNLHAREHQSENQVHFGRLWPRNRSGSPQVGAGERESNCLSQRRSGARDPQQLQQGITGSGGQTCAAGRVHGTAHQTKVKSAVLLFAVVVAGCGGRHRSPVASVPPPPEAPSTVSAWNSAAATSPATDAEPGAIVSPSARIIYTETGWASWYGPSYHKRKAANGEVYDMNGM